MSGEVNTETLVEYKAAGVDLERENSIIDLALTIIEQRMQRGESLTSPQDTKRALRMQLVQEEREVFAVLFLDNRHAIISFDRMFYGTIDSATVHPREIARRALQHNAAAVILAHNHPSGNPKPSQADVTITRQTQEALQLIDVRVLDHFVIGSSDATSMLEKGYL